MITPISRSRKLTVMSLLLIFIQSMIPSELWALTTGPTQEEFASFEPVGTTDLVNLNSGDFTYNIPLLSVPGPNGGYPINLAYHSGIGMDQEASWVGLGWNINVGAINRSLRGLPDDFKGEQVLQEQHQRKSWGVSLDLPIAGNALQQEFFGLPYSQGQSTSNSVGYQLQINYNNYKGLGFRFLVMPQLISSQKSIFKAGLGLSLDSQNGIGIEASLGVGTKQNSNLQASMGVSGAINSRRGLEGFSINSSLGVKEPTKNGGRASAGISSGASYSFGQNVPTVSMAMQNTNVAFNIRLGFGTVGQNGAVAGQSGGGILFPGAWQTDFPLNWSGRVYTSEVKNQGRTQSSAYGYMYSEQADNESLKDFNHTPIAYSQKLPFLSPSTFTHDLFNISGQGTGGSFRAHRPDIGILSPKKTKSVSNSHNIDVEVAIGGQNSGICPTPGGIAYHIGLGSLPFKVGVGESTTGSWADGNYLETYLKHRATNNQTDYEPYYFKALGDNPAISVTEWNQSQLEKWGGDAAVAVKLGAMGDLVHTSGVYGGLSNSGLNLSSNVSNPEFQVKQKRQQRSQVIQSITHEEAAKFGMSANLKYLNELGNQVSKFPNINQVAEDHHISEIVTLQSDGMRYVYGLPAYNLEQEDATFSVDQGNINNKNSLSIPVPNNSEGYAKGDPAFSNKQEFLDKQNIPNYVHSWLLTGVVSADYVDRTADGITDDDYGYWVKFEYQKTSDDYNWRAPYQNANYMPGSTDPFDDKGSYSKGKKELYYLSKIITKTHVAVFETGYRKDGLGASIDKNGGLPTSISNKDKMKRLDKIKLYTTEEYNLGTGGTPLQTTHFEYETDPTKELCKGIPNRDNSAGVGGKLTLKKVFNTLEESNRGELSPYKFTYSSNNPDYNKNSYDCWGKYRNVSPYGNDPSYPFMDLPYTEQNPTRLSQSPADAWHLVGINLPTGGTLNIEYEHDDYSYIEDKKAMQMFDIVSAGSSSPSYNTPSEIPQRGNVNTFPTYSTPYTTDLGNLQHQNTGTLIAPDHQYRLYFPLQEKMPNTTPNQKEWFYQHYIGDTENLFYKIEVDLKDGQGDYDFISGYAEIRKGSPNYYGMVESGAHPGEYDLGYITLQHENVKSFGLANTQVHPFRKSAFQYLKNVRSELIYGGQSAIDIQSLFSPIVDVMTMTMGYEYAFFTRGFANKVRTSGHSVIRLLSPHGKKKGGGTRVKKVTISDNWKEMTGGSSSDYQEGVYGQVYEYTIEENGETISSGVAYEPHIGKEQNPLVQPVRYEHSNLFQAPQNLYSEFPIMFNHYPGANVMYRKVTMKSLCTDDNTKSTPTPITEYEFYTPKDFPIEFDYTVPDRIGPTFHLVLFPGIYTEFGKNIGASQGYSLILNDMAGKPKSVTTKTITGTIVTKQEFEYFTDNDGKLDNEVQIITEDGKYENAIMGVDYDISIDMNENKDVSTGRVQFSFNFEGGLIPYCIPIPTVMPQGMYEMRTSMKTAVVQKIIHKQGIMKSVRITDGTSEITTENVAFDPLTKQPLLTKTKNEFNDDIYNYTSKARWEYKGMDAAFKNIGVSMSFLQEDGQGKGYYTIPSNDIQFFNEGDEVWVTSTSNATKAYVYTVFDDAGTFKIGLMDKDGAFISYNKIVNLTITRSGKKNLLHMNSGGVSAMAYDENSTTKTFSFDKVVDANANQYRDNWATQNCEKTFICTGTGDVCIPLNNVTIDRVFVNGDQVNNYTIGSCVVDDNFTSNICVNTNDPNYQVFVNGVLHSNFSTIGICQYTNPTCEYSLCAYDEYFQVNIGYQDVVNGAFGICTSPGAYPCVDNRSTWFPNPDVSPYGPCDYVDEIVFRIPSSVWADFESKNSDVRMLFSNSSLTNVTNRFPSNHYYPYGSQSSNQNNTITRNVNQGIGTRLDDINAVVQFLNTNDPVRSQVTNNLWSVRTVANGYEIYLDLPGGSSSYPGNPQLAFRYDDANLMNDLSSTPYPIGGAASCLGGVNFQGYNSQNTCTYVTSETNYISRPGVKFNNLPTGNYFLNFTDYNGIIHHSVEINCQPSTINTDLLAVTLPTNTTSSFLIEIKDSQGNITNTQQVNAMSSLGTALTIPLSNVGANTILVNYTSNEGTFSSSYVLPCGVGDETILACESNITTNPYVKGAKGVWRPWASFTYVDDRDYTSPKGVRDQGYITDFTSFNWQNPPINPTTDKWINQARMNKYSPNGYELESVDALGNHTSRVYDNKDFLVEIVGQNARYQELAFDGFEENIIAYRNQDCKTHFRFQGINTTTGALTSDVFIRHEDDFPDDVKVAHTGKSSIVVNPGSKVVAESKFDWFDESTCAEAIATEGIYNSGEILNYLERGDESNVPQIMKNVSDGTPSSIASTPLPLECSCLGQFSFEPNNSTKKYTAGVWVKEKHSNNSDYNMVNYNHVSMNIIFLDAGLNEISRQVFLPSGKIIEHWQKIEGDFQIPPGTIKVQVELADLGTVQGSFFDDFRIHPFEADINTYVYDPLNYKVVAKLDNNNYATIYIYNEKGEIVKVKQETEEGLKTIRESRRHIQE